MFYCKYMVEMVNIVEDIDLAIYHCKLPLSSAVADFFFFNLTGIGIRDVLKKSIIPVNTVFIALSISGSRQLTFVVVADVKICSSVIHKFLMRQCML